MRSVDTALRHSHPRPARRHPCGADQAGALTTPIRCLVLAVLAFTMAACSGTPSPPPSAGLTPTAIPLLGDLAGGPGGPRTLVGLLYVTQDGALLAEGLSLSGPSPLPLGATPIWLGSLRLPDDAPLRAAGAVRYGPAQIAGRLEGPGSFGPTGDFRYMMESPRVELLSVRELDITLLLGNSALYEGQAVHLRGQLLASADSALLSQRLGQGGVPDAAALQVKLAAPIRDRALLDGLSGTGAARYGPVAILGVWRAGVLVPLVMQR